MASQPPRSDLLNDVLRDATPKANSCYVIRRGDKILLKREVVKRLNEHHGFGFRETQLIDELRLRYSLPQPTRYGQKQIPAFRLPAEVIALDGLLRD